MPCYNVNVQNLTPRNWQSSIYYLLLFVAALTLLVLFMPEGTGPEEVAITDFVAAARAGEIDRITQKENALTGYAGDERKLTADYYGSTNDLIWDIPTMIEYLSSTMTLLPGDVIATGTPIGVSNMNPGDVIEIIVDGVGTLRNYVV